MTFAQPVPDGLGIGAGGSIDRGLQPVDQIKLLGDDLRRAAGPGQGTGHDPVKLQPNAASPRPTSSHPLLPLRSQRPLVIGNSRRPVGDGDSMAQNE